MKLKDQEGAAAIEFAIILPLLMMILFGIIEFSIAFYDKAMITNASREGARAGIVFKPVPRETTAENTEIENVVTTFLADKLITLGTSNAPVVAINREGFSTGDSLSITVTYNYDYYVLPGFVAGITGPVALDATTIMKME
ncbi:MAG: pilus assembly protein [Nitrospiraceae bacterium]|nr:MAG: pilus assembly protein [Nitrospiraceae bacterium]UCH44493.1 MAG: pilus assembly protein [Nitrospiraceae bacterium]